MRSSSRFTFALAAFAALAVSAPASAQQRPRVGVGVGLSAFDFNLSMFANNFPAGVPDSIYVPIALTPTFRLEPQLGAATLTQDMGNNPTLEISVVTVGVGAFWLFPSSDPFDAYVGLRLARTSYTSKAKFNGAPTETTSGADIRISPALGGELALHRRFSLGAEVQLQLVTFGERKVSTGGSIPGGSGIQTAGLLFARVYLF